MTWPATRGGSAWRHAAFIVRLAVAAFAFAAGLWMAWQHPLAPRAGTVIFVFSCLVFFCRPGIWLFVLPAALPWLDFSPWTGWVAFEEFDLLVLAVAAGAGARLAWTRWVDATKLPLQRDRSDTACAWLAAVFVLFSTIAFWKGLAGFDATLLDGFQTETDPLNAWRIGKSLLFAALGWPLLLAEVRAGAAVATRRFAAGMVAGLVVVVLAVAWERSAYVGLWHFARPYRTVALFWEMHVGGAAIDAYLAAAAPFAAWALAQARRPASWAAAAALVLGTGYACLSTFSRGVYLGVGAGLVVLAAMSLAAAGRRGPGARPWVLRGLRIVVAMGALAMALAAAPYGRGLPVALVALGASLTLALFAERPFGALGWRTACGVLLGVALVLEVLGVLGTSSFMRTRIDASHRDMRGRLDHWADGLRLLGSPGEAWSGIGLGRLPSAYAAQVPGARFPGRVEFIRPVPGRPEGWFRLSGTEDPTDPRAFMSLAQRVSLGDASPLSADFDVRAPRPVVVDLELCEMHLLYPRSCARRRLRLGPGSLDWQHVEASLQGSLPSRGRGLAPRLGVFSLAVVDPGGTADVSRLRLRDAQGREWLANGDFTQGRARWLPVARGDYLPWHVDELYLELLIERGLPAALAFVAVCAIVLRRLGRRRDLEIAPFLGAAIAGMLCVGTVSSIMDVPRVAWLLFLALLLAVALTKQGDSRVASL